MSFTLQVKLYGPTPAIPDFPFYKGNFDYDKFPSLGTERSYHSIKVYKWELMMDNMVFKRVASSIDKSLLLARLPALEIYRNEDGDGSEFIIYSDNIAQLITFGSKYYVYTNEIGLLVKEK